MDETVAVYSMNGPKTERIPSFCALCTARCGAIATVEDGRLTKLDPDPSHPTGQALCIKGRVAPELVYHPERLRQPLKRTRPKGDADPGWQVIGWDEALDTVAANLKRLSAEHGSKSVVFSHASPSTSALSDSQVWIARLRHAFGSPNLCMSMELCGWGRFMATRHVYGAGVPGEYMPDLENAGCILFWGYNPTVARISHATATNAALKRGAKLIVVDPRQAGLARRADQWLRVRPGTDGALALGIAHVMIERGWYDEAFVRDWTNGTLLVRDDNGRLLRESDVSPAGNEQNYLYWDQATAGPAAYDPARGAIGVDAALFGAFSVATARGPVSCRPVFQLMAELCRTHGPEHIETQCGVAADAVAQAAEMLWRARPTAYYVWSGVEQHTNATQAARAIGLLHALTGSFDGPGGNVLFSGVPAANVTGNELMSPELKAQSLGLSSRPLGPAVGEYTSTDDLYRAITEGQPYGVRGLVVFGANLLMAHADGRRGRKALAALDFYVHADLFMNPTAELADIVLPVATPFETEALNIGFEVSAAAQAHVQLRKRLVEPQGEARSDVQIVFDLACRMGLGEHFWNGDIDAAYRHQLGPSGLTLEALRAAPGGLALPLETTYRKFADRENGGVKGFATPSRKIEFYSETFLAHGYDPLPGFEEPLVSPRSRPDLAERFPLILTCAKDTLFCETQHRALPSLRRRARDPQIDLHPDTAAERKIAAGDWVRLMTPEGSVRARARFDKSLDPGVVCGQHGWWQACAEIDAPGYDPFSSDGANYNMIISHAAADPISGSIPHRAYMCDIKPLA
jgi:anaerobic selenocysteine-containing dehydrogenase